MFSRTLDLCNTVTHWVSLSCTSVCFLTTFNQHAQYTFLGMAGTFNNFYCEKCSVLSLSFHSLPLDIQVRWNVPIACRWDIHLRDVLIRKLQYILMWDLIVQILVFC